MKTGFLLFDHDRNEKSGSSRIRGLNLIKYEPDFEVFQTGSKYDVVVFQKYYWQEYAALYQGIKILDICDPDWLQGTPTMEIVRFVEKMDGIVANTPAMAEYMQKISDKPVVVIEDRHDIPLMKQTKQHIGDAKSVIWFGYSHNAHIVQKYIPKLMEYNLKLTIMSEQHVSVSSKMHQEYRQSEAFVKWPKTMEEINLELIEHDMCLLPKSRRPQDKYKSNNKTTHAWSIGMPVAEWGDDIDRFISAQERITDQKEHLDITRTDYDCKISVQQYKDFIDQITYAKNTQS